VTTTLLFLHAGDDWIRGSEIVLLNLLSRLDRARYRSLLVCNQEILAARAREIEGVEARVLDIPEVMVEGTSVRLPLLRWLQTVRLLRAEIRAQGVALVYCNSALPCQVGYFAAKSIGLPVVAHLHAPYTRRYAWLYRFHRADAAIFVSRFVRGLLENRVRFKNPPLVIHNGVDTDRFSPAPRDPSHRARLGIPPDVLVIGQVGSLIRRKGPRLAIQAMAEPGPTRRGIHLVLVGDGPEAAALRALATSLGVSDRVHFMGQQPDPVPFYRHVFDVNLLASRSEAMGLALLEGSACGLPGIGADAQGTPEALVEGESGLLFPAQDHLALTRVIERFADDPELRATMGRRAREVALERFTLDRQVAEIEEVIAGLLASARER
jgi:glycosyltransferase involved in cell wall biosynthesis